MIKIILKISLILIYINICNTFEYRYIPNSEEYDKKLMLNSIVNDKNNRFVSRFDLNKLKHRRWDIHFNDKHHQDIIKPTTNIENDIFKKDVINQTEDIQENVPDQNDIVQQNDIKQSENTLSTNLINITNEIIMSSTISSQSESALSYDSKNISEFIYQKPLTTNLNYDIQAVNNSDSLKKLPIYFTNPLTGILYAITEVGYNYSEPLESLSLNDTNSIPIYIPKEQYDRDMNLLKLEFMKQCRFGQNRKNRTKTMNFSNNTSSVVKPHIKPVKTQIEPLKISLKKRKTNKKHPKPTVIVDDDDVSGSFSGISNVFDEVFNVIDDSGSSSEEHIKIGTKFKPKRNNKLIKKKIQIKPSLTTTFIKNGNQTLKIINNKFLTQVEKPINKITTIPFPGHTTMQSFVSSIPLQRSNWTNLKDSIFSSRSFMKQISKRSIRTPNLWSMYDKYKSIHRTKPIQSTTLTNFITEIPIVLYTTPSMDQFYVENHRISKRSLRATRQKTQQPTTERTESLNTIPYELKHTKRMTKTKLMKVKKNTPTIITTTISTPLIENFTETPRAHETIPTYIHYSEKEELKILSSKNSVTAPPLRIITTPLVPVLAITSPPYKKPKKSHTQYDDEDDYLLNYEDLPFGTDYDSKDEDSKDDSKDEEDDDNDYSVEDSSESEEYLGHDISEINNKDPYHMEKKRKRKRKPDDDEEDYDNDYDDNDFSDAGDIMKFINMFFYPARSVWTNIMANAGDLTSDDRVGDVEDDADDDADDYVDNKLLVNIEKRKPKYPKYTVYNNKISNSEAEESSSSWFTSWFSGSDDDVNKNDDNNTSEVNIGPGQEQPGWFDNWFGYDERSSTTPPTSIEDYDDEDDGFLPDWLSNWFDSTKKNKKTINRQSTTTSTTPLLTISNPMKNPQKWIGILAQHIVNSTATPSSITSPQFEDDEPQLITYDKYQIWRLKPFGENQVKALERYKNSADGSKLQWLQGPTLRGLTDVLVPPKLRTDFQGTLNFEDIAHEVLIFDVGKAIYYESKDNSVSDSTRNAFAWKKYQTYDRIIRFIETLQVRNPNFIELFHIGRSYEGRPLVIVKISIKEPLGRKKLKLQHKNNNRNNGVFIEAGLHGREWIAPASATWIINNIVKIMKSNQTTSDAEYIKKMTWFIMPILNPDGYEYSHEYDRMWRKSRSKHLAKSNGLLNTAMTWFQQQKSEKICFGVDFDQNWNYDWGKDSTKSQCNEFYAGPNAFSEPETRAVSKFLIDHRKKIKLFISLQAYGQIISYPNKLNTSFSSQKMDDLLDVAMVGNDALRKSGSNSRYKIDSTNDLVAVRSGSSTYFAMYEAGIPFSYTIHLGDNGVHGYLLPSSNIESTAKDAFQIIKAMVDYI